MWNGFDGGGGWVCRFIACNSFKNIGLADGLASGKSFDFISIEMNFPLINYTHFCKIVSSLGKAVVCSFSIESVACSDGCAIFDR